MNKNNKEITIFEGVVREYLTVTQIFQIFNSSFETSTIRRENEFNSERINTETLNIQNGPHNIKSFFKKFYFGVSFLDLFLFYSFNYDSGEYFSNSKLIEN
jgi:hypothetical protein